MKKVSLNQENNDLVLKTENWIQSSYCCHGVEYTNCEKQLKLAFQDLLNSPLFSEQLYNQNAHAANGAVAGSTLGDDGVVAVELGGGVTMSATVSSTFSNTTNSARGAGADPVLDPPNEQSRR